MSDVAQVIRSLLEALRAAGDVASADAFEHEFNARGWDLGLKDQLAVLARLQAGITSSSQAKTPAATPAPNATATPDVISATDANETDQRVELPAPGPRFAAFGGLAPWVAVLPDDWRLLEDVHGLLEARGLDHLVDTLERLFVDRLGYEAARFDESIRLTGQTTLTKVVVVARHEDFFVVAVTSKYAGFHTSSYDPVFQLHPRAIVFAHERGARVRVIVPRVGGSSPLLGQRVMWGRGRRAFPDDDLFIWARRLSLLAPATGDDGRSLAKRADAVIRDSATSLVREWPSVVVNADAIPGPDWDASVTEDVSRFLQHELDEKLEYGLQADLRTSFPWVTHDERVTLRCLDYRLVENDEDWPSAHAADHAISHAATLVATIELSLELEVRDAESGPCRFVKEAAIVVPDRQGTFVVWGEPMTFCPGLSTPTADPGTDDDPLDASDEIEAEIDDSPEDSARTALQVNDDNHDNDESPPDVYRGEGLVPLLRLVVGRRLRAMAARFAGTSSSRVDSLAKVLAWLGANQDARGRLRFSAFGALLRHLHPCGEQTLRTIAVDTVEPPPTWACLDYSRFLDPGLMYPVAGARIGPGGVLCGPVWIGSGRATLQSTSTTAKANPRITGVEEAAASAWIARPLARFALLPIATLKQPVHDTESSFVWEGPAFTALGNWSHVRVSNGTLQPLARRHRWVVDLPRHPHVSTQPIALVGPGQAVVAGTAILEHVNPWTDVDQTQHALIDVGLAMEQGQIGLGSGKAPRLVIRCPPGVSGVIERLDIVEVRDPRATVTRHRVTLVTRAFTLPTRVITMDGRVLPVRHCGPEGLPWRAEDGEGFAVALCGDDPEAEGGGIESPWRGPETGQPILGSVSTISLTFLLAPRGRAPDPCLEYRILDGWGIPRSSSDAKLTVGMLRQYAAEHPDAAADVLTAIAAVHGHAPAATTVFELSRASHLAPPALVPNYWSAEDGVQQNRTDYDPVRTTIHRRGGDRYHPKSGPWHWTCDCGAFSGRENVQMYCAVCGRSVKRRWTGEPAHVISLPAPVMHPWRKHLIAALLGLIPDELERVIRRHDGSALVEPTRLALAEPTRNLRVRLAASGDDRMAAGLGRARLTLERAVARGLQLTDLWLDRLEVLSPRLLVDGYRSGAPDLLHSPLTTSYRRIQGLAKLQTGENETLRQSVWIELQRSIDTLFGNPGNEQPPAGSLAAMWRRVWPTTAPISLPIAVPGLFEGCTAEDLRASLVSRLLDADLPDDHAPRNGVVTADGVKPLPFLQLDLPGVTPDDWREHNAWSRCVGPLITRLAAVVLGIDARPAVLSALSTVPGAEVFSGLEVVGPTLVREFFRRLRPSAGGRPSRVLTLLDRTSAQALPRDRDRAYRWVEECLAVAVPGDELGALLVRRAVTEVLVGFWHGSPDADTPHDWLWTPKASDVPDRYRRAIPPLTDDAWLAWPGFDLMTNPVVAAVNGWQQDDEPGFQQWIGVPASFDLPSLDELSSVQAMGLDEPVVAELPESTDVRILTISLGHWIAEFSKSAN